MQAIENAGITNIKFTPIEGYNLEVGNASPSARKRIIIFRRLPYDHVEHISNTNVLLIGQSAKVELHRLLSEHGRPTVYELVPGGISSSTYTAMRKHLGF